MLIGHYAPALALQRARPTVPLAALFMATQLVDVGWASFILAGVEHARVIPHFNASNDLDLWDMPYTHSLAATGVWAVASAALWWGLSRKPSRAGDALIVALAVASHFAADFLVHVHDLPILAAQGPKLGLGLWQNRPLALALETGLFGAAAAFWWWPRRGAARGPAVGWVLLALTALAAATFYIPTPPTPTLMALSGLATYLAMGVLARWMDLATAAGPVNT